jgi:hypothetical protein
MVALSLTTFASTACSAVALAGSSAVVAGAGVRFSGRVVGVPGTAVGFPETDPVGAAVGSTVPSSEVHATGAIRANAVRTSDGRIMPIT